MVCRDGPIIIPEATPPFTPALSPMLIGIVVPRLWAGIIEIMCLSEAVGGKAIGSCAVFGYGIGTGPAGVGVKQTSGIAKFIPFNEQFANITILLCIFNPCGFVHRQFLCLFY